MKIILYLLAYIWIPLPVLSQNGSAHYLLPEFEKALVLMTDGQSILQC